MTPQEHADLMQRIFMPYAFERMENARSTHVKFAHYTSAAAAVSIIENQEVWLRNALLMNDFKEVQHGQECLAASWHDEQVGGRLRRLLGSIDQDLPDQIAVSFDDAQNDRYLQSYMISMSEHGDDRRREDRYGRLSMWRAYGGETNVAFVFKSTPFVTVNSASAAYSSPVLYADSSEFKTAFKDTERNMERNIAIIKDMDPTHISRLITWAFHFAVLSTKHPGFHEEREWRVLYSPEQARSDNLVEDYRVIGGVPQRIFRLKLENDPEHGVTGSTIAEGLEEIIIGPTATPWPIYETLATKLAAIGVSNPWDKVKASEIPLRR